MKVRIKTFKGKLPDYFTYGREYRVAGRIGSDGFLIYCDDFHRSFITLSACRHLNGGEWEVVDDLK